MSLGPDRRPSAARAPPQGRAGVEARVAAPGRGGRSAREDRLQALDDRLRAVEVAFGKVDQRLGRSPAGRGGEGLADRGLHRPVATRASRSSRGFEVGCDNISRQRMGNDNQRLVAAAACCIWLLTVVALVSGQAEPPHVTELRRAAEQSHADAQANLGNLYADGRGVPQDYGEAVRWWRLAADQGHADAQANLGTTYAFSRGVPQDYGVAARWYRLAAEQGLANAQFNLGVLYADGRGVPQDYGEAVRWWRLAADQGRADAQSTSASCTSMAGTTGKPLAGIVSLPTKAAPTRSSTSAACTTTAGAFRRITSRPTCGRISLPRRATRTRADSAISSPME